MTKDFVKTVKSNHKLKTTVFNNLQQTRRIYEFVEVPAIDSWHSRYFKIKIRCVFYVFIFVLYVVNGQNLNDPLLDIN